MKKLITLISITILAIGCKDCYTCVLVKDSGECHCSDGSVTEHYGLTVEESQQAEAACVADAECEWVEIIRDEDVTTEEYCDKLFNKQKQEKEAEGWECFEEI